MNTMGFMDQDWEDDQHGPHIPGFGTSHGPMDGPGFGRPHGPLDRPPKFEGSPSLSEVFMMLKTNGG